jgi:hypothetical protein
MRVARLLAVCALAGCSPAGLASPDGQLFCAFQTDGGGAAVADLLDAGAASLSPAAAPAALLATGAAKADLDAACAAAAPPAAPAAIPAAPAQ